MKTYNLKFNYNTFGALVTKINPNNSQGFTILVDNPLKYKKDSLKIHYDSTLNTYKIVDQIKYKTYNINATQFGRIIFKGWTKDWKDVKYFNFKQHSNWNLYFTTIESDNIKKSLVNDTYKLTLANYQKDPLTIKKTKYRFDKKAYWLKQSDFARNKGSRLSRYNTLYGMAVDSKLKYTYLIKLTALKFLAWKLNMSVNALKAQLDLTNIVNSNKMNSFINWLNNRLVNILVISGFLGNYTLTTKLINQGLVSVNGTIMKDVNYSVSIGDIITINSKGWKSIYTHKTRLISHLWNDSLLIDWNIYSIIVTKLPNIAEMLLKDINSNLMRSISVGAVKDPLNSILLRIIPLICR